MRDDPEDDVTVRLDEFLPFQLAVVANKVSQTIARIIEEEFKLHIPEWRILATLLYHSPVSSQMLVQQTAMDPARVSRSQTRLSDLGLIDVQQDPDDKRRVLIKLTQRGSEIVSETIPRAIEVEKEIFGSLSDGERSCLETTLEKLFKVLGD
jgi:DNA-binding MarR family transcriptional regulator